jgi:hypothetical protein
MKSPWIFATVIAVGCVGWFGRSVIGGEPPKDGAQPDWMALAQPGEEHARLAKLVGDWNVSGVFHMPGQPDSKGDSTATFKAILGGRYIQQNVAGSMMGMPFEGQGVFGYDNGEKKYVSSWLDTWGTGMMNGTGTETEKGKIWVFQSVTAHGPTEETLTMVSDKEFTFHMKVGGNPAMELTYKRK